ncbi:hypothetical protein ACEPPN_002921 [Leptodophora sp. 'Broadleaf-Isolate-01']
MNDYLPLAAITLILLYLGHAVFHLVFRDPLRAIPGPLLSKVSTAEITFAGLGGRRAQRLLELHKTYGPIVRIGAKEVSVGSWKYYRAIYGDAKSSSKDPSFYSAATFVGKDNLFQIVNKSQHAARRKMGAAPYSQASTTLLEPLVRAKASSLVERLISEAASSPTHVADAYKLCGLFSFEVVCKAAFAKDFDRKSDYESLEMLRAMDASAMTLIFDSVMPWLRNSGLATHIPGQIGHSYSSRDFWESKSREVVDDFLANTQVTDSYILTPYIKGKDAFMNRSLVKEEIVEESMGLMFAGSGTTSTTLIYLLYALSRPENHQIQQSLREEVRNASDDLITIKNLPYLNAVIKEAFRLYPTIISTLPRVLDEPLEVESHVLPPGTVVGMQNLVHHRDPDVFPEPEQFSPERWLSSTKDMEAALTPFSIGRRSCVGQNLAWLELHLALYLIFSRVELRLSEQMQESDMEMEDRFNVAARGKKLFLEVKSL